MKSLGKKEKGGLFVLILTVVVGGGIYIYSEYSLFFTDPFVREVTIFENIPEAFQDDYIRARGSGKIGQQRDIETGVERTDWRRVEFSSRRNRIAEQRKYTLLVPDGYFVDSLDESGIWSLALFRKADYVPDASIFSQRGPRVWLVCEPAGSTMTAEITAHAAVFFPSVDRGEPNYVSAYPITIDGLSGWRAVAAPPYAHYNSTYFDVGPELCSIHAAKERDNTYEINAEELQEFLDMADAVMATLQSREE